MAELDSPALAHHLSNTEKHLQLQGRCYHYHIKSYYYTLVGWGNPVTSVRTRAWDLLIMSLVIPTTELSLFPVTNIVSEPHSSLTPCFESAPAMALSVRMGHINSIPVTTSIHSKDTRDTHIHSNWQWPTKQAQFHYP